ncbi:2Fe-2S iron-sulfur cluster binding domain-containing protein [Comamonadaceae bacterium G21597-S1]|nr:2Fe-2S iron-sulfur cluster binding domain-containing protein [Comamonadaceae bacterium G21597-S1]
MNHQIQIEFSDGERTLIDAREGQTILQSATTAGVRLAYDCKQGQCQTCKLQLRLGSVHYANREKLTLTAGQEAEGAVLPCQGMADGHLQLVAPYTRASLLPVKQKTVEVVSVQEAGPCAITVTCRLGAHSKFEHLAGQYVRVGVAGSSEERSYSMTTSTADWPEMAFLVRLIPGGTMSSRLAQLEPGSKLTVRGPYGSFYLRDGDAPLIWVAGGTGLAPFLAMLSALRHAGRINREIILCFGANAATDLCWPAGMKELLQEFPRLSLRMSLTQPPEGWTGVTGTVVDALALEDLAGLASLGARAYLCGPPSMVAAARILLAERGFVPGDVFNEDFLPSLQS